MDTISNIQGMTPPRKLLSGHLRGTLNGSHTSVTDETYAECWSLDQTGNWQKYLQDDDGSGWDLNQSRTANTVNEITGISASTGPTWVTPAYSKAGNMTTMPQPADPTASFTATYDAWNRLVKLVDDTTTHTIASYQYDGAKRRVVEQTYTAGSLEETRHCYFTDPSKWQVIEERLDSSTDPEQQHIWGLRYIDDILLRDRDTNNNGTLDERLYGLQDANCNVTCLIDSSGAAQERFAYSAYGQPVFLDASFAPQTSSSSDWETLYAGYRWDNHNGLFNARNRVLTHVLGTWIQRDPLGLSEGVNCYWYVNLSPINNVDPLGL
ncbi:MAG: RHS repeat-associated core domain-containing protein [Planctomycetaceae bacterium]